MSGQVKVSDFGLTTFISEDGCQHTTKKGTPLYMSPEQVKQTCCKSSNRSARRLLVQTSWTPGFYSRPGVYLRPGYYSGIYGTYRKSSNCSRGLNTSPVSNAGWVIIIIIIIIISLLRMKATHKIHKIQKNITRNHKSSAYDNLQHKMN